MEKGKMTMLNESLLLSLFGLAQNKTEVMFGIRDFANMLLYETKAERINLRDANFEYVGEFYERYAERGFVLSDKDNVTLALFYALGFTEFTEVDFNEYQINDFMAKLDSDYANNTNPMMDFAMYLIKEKDANYFENLATRTLDIQTMSMLICLSTYVLDDVELLKKLLEMSDEVFSSNAIFSNENEFLFTKMMYRLNYIKYDTVMNSLDKNHILNIYKRGISGKLATKAIIKKLSDAGYSSSNIDGLSFILKYKLGDSALKEQRAAINTFATLCSKEDEFNEVDKAVLRTIFDIGDFDKKMEGGLITSMRGAINYYQEYNSIANLENFKTIMRMGIADKSVIDNSRIEYDFEKDNDVLEKLAYVNSIIPDFNLRGGRQIKDGYAVNKLHTVLEKCKERKIAELVISKFLSTFEFENIMDAFTQDYCNYQAQNAYNALCNLSIFDVYEHVKENLVAPELWKIYLTHNTSTKKYQVVKYLFENNREKEIADVFDRNIFREKVDTKFFANDAAIEEHKEFVNFVGEYAINVSLIDFRYFYLNLMVNEVNNLKAIYTSDEIQVLYQTALSLASNLDSDDGYYSHYRFRRESTIENLNTLYMSEEEKERIAKEKQEMAEREKTERLEREKQESKKRITNAIVGAKSKGYKYTNDIYKFVKHEISYEDERTEFFKEFALDLFNNAIAKDTNDAYYLTVNIASMMEYKRISLDEMQRLISSISIKEETSENLEENIA